MKGENGTVVQSVLRALDILCYFQDNEELGISEISRMIGLGKSTVYALVNSLVCRNFLEQSPISRKYRLGIRNFELGRYTQQRMDLRRGASPIVMEVLGKFHETVHLAAHDQGEVVYIESYRVPDVTILYTQTGRRAPMHCSSVGKAMLAFLPGSYLQQYVLNQPLKALTKYTITEPEALLRDLKQVREQGYATDDQEIEMDLRCIGAPIFDFSKSVIGAVSICGPIYRMGDMRMKEIAPEIVRCSRLISYRMGYKEGIQ